MALKFHDRAGDEPDAHSNTPRVPSSSIVKALGYIGDIVEMANARLYRFWADLSEALKTGRPQNKVKHSGQPMIAKLYETPERFEQFLNAMSGIAD